MNLPWGLEFEAAAPGLEVDFDFDPATAQLHTALRNPGSTPIAVGEVRLTAGMDEPAAGGSAWLHGRYMQMDALVRVFGAPAEEGYDGRYRRAGADEIAYVSRGVATVSLPSRQTPVLLLGVLREDRFFFDIELRLDASEERVLGITLVFDLEGTELPAGESLALPAVVVREGPDPVALIEQYAEEVADEMGARVPDRVPPGWCSWYYFYGRVSEADVLSNLEAMVRDGHPADYVQIDDGYQSATGDWLTPNAKFPSGMAALARQIREAGYRPGIWLAPFVMHEESAVLRERPEMALRTREGEALFVETWLGRCAVLDCTHPASQEWLREVVRTVVHEWGYEYLKIDALAFAAQPATRVRYHLAGTTAPANLRQGLEVIREAAGDEAFILGCTCHFMPAIGLVDAMRVGPDVKEVWAAGAGPSVKHAMRLALQRNWMHGRWWANDPDCLIVRDTETGLGEPEVRFLATGIAVSGGMVVASDDLAKLSPARREMALALMPPPGVAARPAGPAEGPVASAWRADLGEGRFLLGILNWDDEPRWVVPGAHLEAGEIAFDVWGARVVAGGDVLLRPHEGALWQVAAPGPTPRVVGDSGHVNYHGLHRRQVSGRVQVRNDSPRPRTVAIEARGQVFEVDLEPREMRWFQ
jgi:alpha-galactosidase